MAYSFIFIYIFTHTCLFCRPELPSVIQTEEFLLVFLVIQACWQHILCFCLNMYLFYFYYWRIGLPGNRILGFCTLTMLLQYLWLHSFWREFSCQSYHFPIYGISLAPFKICFLSLHFSSLTVLFLVKIFLVFTLAYYIFYQIW